MSVNLVVAADLDLLAVRLGEVLADRPGGSGVPDVFATEVVAVPSAGVESWLVRTLATQAPAAGQGPPVIAGIDFAFPSTLVMRALGREGPSPVWPTIGSLTWAVHAVLAADEELEAAFATQPGVSRLARSRSLADLFDRYLLHRPDMVRAWERDGVPARAGVAQDQARLWHAVTSHLGVSVATCQQEDLGALASGDIEPDLPARVSLFGVSSLPTLHREVLTALGHHRQVHLFAPVVSPSARRQVLDAADPLAAVSTVGHRLVRSWGSGNIEDHLLLLGLADDLELLELEPEPAVAGPSLLGRLQASVRSGIDPRQGEPVPLAADDASVRWHRCYGPARQAEAVADAVRHLLEPTEGGDALEFRDIVILCSDVPRFAPLVQAAFAGRDDVAEVPLAVTDLSLATTTPLVDVTVGLLSLLDGRFRPADVLALAGRSPVARRFGFTASDLADLTELTASVHVAWGADPDGRARYLADHGGLTVGAPLGSRTWAEGLAQLLAGAALADRGVHAAAGLPAVPLAGLESPAIAASVGRLAALVDCLNTATTGLCQAQSPLDWVDHLVTVLDDLVTLTDDDAWQWRRLEEVLDGFAADATTSEGQVVAGSDLAALLSERLGGATGRARFGSGAVTLTSLTGLRGVPHEVVILLGLDGDFGASGTRADDLVALDRRAGEPHPTREVRAQLLDAVLAAGSHLLIVSTATDPRSNKEVAPSVPIAEFLSLVDDTATAPGGSPASRAVAVRHPRHAWSTPNFTAGSDAVLPGRRWGFDAPALAAARLRELAGGDIASRDRTGDTGIADASGVESGGWAPFGPDPGLVPVSGDVTLRQLALALRNPAEAYLTERLGLRLPGDRNEASGGVVELKPAGLERYHLVDGLWDLIGPGSPAVDAVERDPSCSDADREAEVERLREAWRDGQAARGALPPSPFLEPVFAEVDRSASAFRSLLAEVLGGRVAKRVPLSVSLGSGGMVTGDAVVVHDGDESLVLDVRVARRKPGDVLAGLVTLAAVVAEFPGQSWRLLQVRRPAKDRAGSETDEVWVALRADAGADQGGTAIASEVLEWAVDYRRHALGGFFPALPATLAAVWTSLVASDGTDLDAAISAWGDADAEASSRSTGDRADRWVSMPGESPEFEELWDLPPTAVEQDWVESHPPSVSGADRRLGVWAARLWGRAGQFADGVEP